MVSAEFDQSASLIRPGKKLSIKVTVVAELCEPIFANIFIHFKNLESISYPIKFVGMENPYKIAPTLIDVPRSKVNTVGLILRNLGDATIHDMYVENECIKEKGSSKKCTKLRITPQIVGKRLKFEFSEKEAHLVNFVAKFTIREEDTFEKRHFAVPFYIFINDNAVNLFPQILDFGILYANSDFSHKLHIRAKTLNRGESVMVGMPFVENHSYLEFDFHNLVKNNGEVRLEDTYMVGSVTLKTQGLKEGNYTGVIVFKCKGPSCLGDGITQLEYRFMIMNDPMDAKSRKHSFEVPKKLGKKKRKSYKNQILSLKNNFDKPFRIQDITTHDKELSISIMNQLKIDEIPEAQHC